MGSTGTSPALTAPSRALNAASHRCASNTPTSHFAVRPVYRHNFQLLFHFKISFFRKKVFTGGSRCRHVLSLNRQRSRGWLDASASSITIIIQHEHTIHHVEVDILATFKVGVRVPVGFPAVCTSMIVVTKPPPSAPTSALTCTTRASKPPVQHQASCANREIHHPTDGRTVLGRALNWPLERSRAGCIGTLLVFACFSPSFCTSFKS